MSKLYICMYHYTRDLIHSRYPLIKGMDLNHFKEQMMFFKNNFNVVCMEQVIDSVKGGGSLPDDPLLLTFDDGYIDNYTFALPILEEFGFQGSFFVPGIILESHKLLDINKVHFILACSGIKELVTDLEEQMDYYRGSEYDYPSNEELRKEYATASRLDDSDVIFVKRMLQTALPERVRNQISSELFKKYVGVSEEQFAYELYLTYDQLRTMKRHGMFIGIHGYNHYWLGNIPPEQAKNDIVKATDTLKEFIDPGEWVINYPFGSYSDEIVEFAREKGACIGLTTECRVANIGEDDLLKLPRLDCIDFPPRSDKYNEF